MSWKKVLTEGLSATDIASSPASGKVLKVSANGTGVEWGTDSSAFSISGSDAYYTAGSVGIGTSSPSVALEVTGGSGLKLVNTGNTTVFHIPATSVYQMGTLTDDPIAIYTNNAERMRITNTGIGIGTDSPDSLLELESSASIGHTLSMKSTSGNSSARLKLDFNGNDGSQGSKGYLQFNNSTNSIELQSASGKKLRFQTGGTTDRMILDNNSKISLANNDNGTGNTIYGYGTGNNLASGSNYNVLMGWDVANQGLNGGDFNVSIGTNSSRSLTSGSYNVAVGSNAHYSISTGGSNTAIGNSALYHNATGNFNVAIGRDSQGGASGNSHSNNTSVGYASLMAITTGTNNLSLGFKSGNAITTGGHNTILGYEAMKLGTNNGYSTAIGYRAGYTENGSNLMNVSVGANALYHNELGSANTAVGTTAMYGLYAGDDATPQQNVSVGYDSMYHIVSGSYNIAIGFSAGYKLTDNSHNIAIGRRALYTADSGENNNVVIGDDAGRYINNSNADHNVFVGNSSGQGGTGALVKCIAIGSLAMDGTGTIGGTQNIFIGDSAGGGTWVTAVSDGNVGIGANSMLGALNGALHNTALGFDTLKSMTTSNYNVAIGAYSQFRNTTGSANTSLGTTSLYNNEAGQYNTAFGYESLVGTSASNYSYNVGVGYQSLRSITTGGSNVGVGYKSLYAITEGLKNVAVGHESLLAMTTGDNNVAIGYNSADVMTTGTNNTSIGMNANSTMTTGEDSVYVGAYTKSSAVDITNELVFGAGEHNDLLIGKGNDTITTGSVNGYIWCDFSSNATWQQVSDERIKKDIKDLDLGLLFINDLRPVTYKKKSKSEYPKTFNDYNENKTKANDKKLYGFIAQEVKEAMDKANHSDFTAWTESEDGMQGLGVTELITPLVKAVQQLSTKIDELEKQLKEK